MLISKEEQAMITKLHKVYKEKGFVTEELILNEIVESGLSLEKVDYVCDYLLSAGIIISNELNVEINDEDDIYDRSQTDYEYLFSQIIEIDEGLKPFIEEIRQIKPPQHRELQNLIPQAKNNNIFAKERIINMYLRTVVRIGLWYSDKYKVPLAETIQDGCVGLVIAFNKFEIDKQENFSQYAPWWVRQNISREAQTLNPHMYFPVHIKEKLFSIYEIVEQNFCEQNDKKHICSEFIKPVSEKLDCSLEEAEDYIGYLDTFDSIEEIVSKDENCISDNGSFEEQIIYNYNKKELLYTLSNILETLKEREKEIILLRFGFVDDKQWTLEEVGKKFKLTRERIRQIEAKTIRKLQNPSNAKKLVCFLE